MMKRFEPGQLIVARSPYTGKPLLVLSAVDNEDGDTWTVEFIRDQKVVKARMHPGSWTLLQDPM